MRVASVPQAIFPRRGLSVAAPRWLAGVRISSWERWLLVGSLAVAALAHGVNMGGYPSFSLADDEGI
ncbi:MAG: hypothetical protein NVS1B1_09680 [Candidatus Limnocylindrales bacterium]